jgi:hypothetical protein
LLGRSWESSIAILKILSVSIVFRAQIGLIDAVIRLSGNFKKSNVSKGIFGILITFAVFIGLRYNNLMLVSIGVDIAVFINYLSMIKIASNIIGFKLTKVLKLHLKVLLYNLPSYSIVIIFWKLFSTYWGNVINLLGTMAIYALCLVIAIKLMPFSETPIAYNRVKEYKIFNKA